MPMLDTLHSVIENSRVSEAADQFTLHEVRPGAIVEPRSAEEAAAVLKLASEQQWRVECAGAGTQAFGNRRTRADIILSARALTRINEYEAADLVIGVQAGLPLHRLAQETRRNAQFFAQDPPADEHSTVGGVVATGRSGPLRFSQGTPRDHVLGLQVVTGDGRILDVGGRVVKNVAGYDLVRLLVGSAGTLGLITSAYLRLKPIPQRDETIHVTASQASALLDLTQFVVDHKLEASAIELIAPGTLGDAWSLLVRLSGSAEAVADARARIAAESARLSAAVAPAGADVWAQLAALELKATTIVRLADLPARLPATLQQAEKLLHKLAGRHALVAHAGDGVVRLYLGDTPAEETAFAIGEARSVMQVTAGTLVVHSRSAELMRRADAFGAVGPAQPLMARLKQIFDPAGILAPGRFVV